MKGRNMELEQLIERFFNYRKVLCEDIEAEYSSLRKSNMFLPIILLLVKKSVNDTVLEEAILSFNLRKKEESLCYFSVEEFEFRSLNSVVNIIEELNLCDQVPGIKLNDKLKVEISDLVLNCRKKLVTIPEGAFFTSDALFKIIFSEGFSLNLSEEFIQIQLEVLSFCEVQGLIEN
jgi:hypothetical protein